MTDESRPPEPWVGSANGRGSFGQFAPGNKLGTGNPNAKRHAELKRALLDCASAEDIREWYAAMSKLAKEGDVQAFKVLIEHLVGRPAQTIELTGADGAGRVSITVNHVAVRNEPGNTDSDTSLALESADREGLMPPV